MGEPKIDTSRAAVEALLKDEHTVSCASNGCFGHSNGECCTNECPMYGDEPCDCDLARMQAAVLALLDERDALRTALSKAMHRVPEDARTRRRYIDIDEAAGSTYEVVPDQWWLDAVEALGGQS